MWIRLTYILAIKFEVQKPLMKAMPNQAVPIFPKLPYTWSIKILEWILTHMVVATTLHQ